MMRGKERKQQNLFVATKAESLVERGLAKNHPLRKVRANVDAVLASLHREIDELYSTTGRPSIPPERLFRAMVWQALYSIRSERLLEEQIRFDMKCRWFVGLTIDEDAWDHSVFSKARENVLLETLAELFFERHVEFMRAQGLVSDEHFSVDGTYLGAHASQKSVRRKDSPRNPKDPPPPGGPNAWVDFKGEKRSNETHASTTDADARLANKGQGTKLAHELDVLTENRNNIVVGITVGPPSGTAERDAAVTLLRDAKARGFNPKTLGADAGYCADEFICRLVDDLGIEPHVAIREDFPNSLARVYVDKPGYVTSIRKRMRIEEVFGYLKTIAGLAKVRVVGAFRVYGAALVGVTAWNLNRQANLA